MTKILVVDNYDSFVYTLNGYLQELGAETVVVRNDSVDLADLADYVSEFDGVLISPGPGKPQDAGISIPTIQAAVAVKKPVLGVCLGHQAIAEAYGATVTVAEELMHGKTSRVVHDGTGIYSGLPQNFTATRYHSLAVVDETVPAEINVTSRTAGGVIMGLKVTGHDVYGVQFHPESVLTVGGYRLLGNWLELVGVAGAAERGTKLSPLIER